MTVDHHCLVSMLMNDFFFYFAGKPLFALGCVHDTPTIRTKAAMANSSGVSQSREQSIMDESIDFTEVSFRAEARPV